jgi:hypothetical protein
MRAGGYAGLGGFVVLAGLAGCEVHEPPTPEGSPSVARAELGPGSTSTSAPTATSTATSTATTDSGTDASLLPQTHDAPHSSGAAFDARVAALWDAIVHDTPDTGTAFFFPLGAYQQVKDVADPESDWKHRLLAAYRHDIHALHGRLGDAADRATFVGFDVSEARVRWVEPGEEWNKIGYFRVFDSKLRYIVDGEPHVFDVKSLISWRGEWFTVHLSAIK